MLPWSFHGPQENPCLPMTPACAEPAPPADALISHHFDSLPALTVPPPPRPQTGLD